MGASFHKWYSLRYIIKGTAVLKAGETEMVVHAGDYFCVPSDVVYQIAPLYGKLLGYYDFKFFLDDPFLQEKLRVIHPPLEADRSSKEMLDYLMNNWNVQDQQNQSNCENLLVSLLLLLFMKEVRYETRGSRFILTESYNKATQKILHYIENHYFAGFTLEEMGAELNYNKNYLCDAFSKNVGISIIDYVNYLKMRKAIGSFLYFSYDVATTAEGLGFNGTDYFGRIFKRFVGVPPRDFYRAVSGLSAEERSRFSEEPLLSYRPCAIEEGLCSMRRIGKMAMGFKEQKEQKELTRQ